MTTKPILLGLYSPTMQSGKTTVARILADEFNFTTLRFAGPLKAMLNALLEDVGIDEATRERMLYGDLKETPIPQLCHETPRKLMQTLGTEWGRNAVRSHFWIDIMFTQINHHMAEGRNVVVDDVRFANEFYLIRDMDGGNAEITRDGIYESSHVSEGALNGYPFDYLIKNTGTLENLRKQVNGLVAAIKVHQYYNELAIQR